MIDSYKFGKIIVDGKKYLKDVIVFPEYVKSDWWRKEGHNLSFEDFAEVLPCQPTEIIIGNGYSGVMSVSADLVAKLSELNILVIVARSSEAVKLFNDELAKQKKVVGMFHLTC